MSPKSNKLLLSSVFLVVIAVMVCPDIRAIKNTPPPGTMVFVNQIGYLPDQPKWIVSAGSATQFTLIDEATNREVKKGELREINDKTSAKHIWRGEFTNVVQPGRYRIEVPEVGASYPFTIGKDIYNPLLKLGMRSYYLQRCGVTLNDKETGLVHPVCHDKDGLINLKDQFYDLDKQLACKGGWHDAGDYGKYVTTTTVTAAQMMVAFELWPEKFTDGQFHIPESGNGIPDILDEARVGLEWLFTMQRPDGAVYYKLSGKRWPSFCAPELDTQTRYIYGISTADTGKYAATMAIAARVWGKYDPVLRERARQAALKAWKYLSSHGYLWQHSDFDDEGSGAYGTKTDQTDRLWAALEISTLSKEFQPINDMLPQLTNYNPTSIGWTDAALLGLFDYARTVFAKQEIKLLAGVKVVTLADKYINASKISGYRYSLDFGEFEWASNKEGLSRGIAMLLANQLQTKSEYYENALAQLDFVLGLNPLSQCFVTGIGSNPVTNPHHRFMAASGKTVPGLMTGGPNNKAESGAEPKEKGPLSYTDSLASYSSNEPAIDYNAALIFIAAAFSTKQ